MRIFRDQYRMKAALDHVSDQSVALVEVLRISAVEVVHAGGQVRLRRPDRYMIVIGHHAIGKDLEVELLDNHCKQVQPDQMVTPVEIDVAAPVAT
jgi:hypothetical protein